MEQDERRARSCSLDHLAGEDCFGELSEKQEFPLERQFFLCGVAEPLQSGKVIALLKEELERLFQGAGLYYTVRTSSRLGHCAENHGLV